MPFYTFKHPTAKTLEIKSNARSRRKVYIGLANAQYMSFPVRQSNAIFIWKAYMYRRVHTHLYRDRHVRTRYIHATDRVYTQSASILRSGARRLYDDGNAEGLKARANKLSSREKTRVYICASARLRKGRKLMAAVRPGNCVISFRSPTRAHMYITYVCMQVSG